MWLVVVMLTLLGTNVATVQSVSDEAKYASSALTPPIAGDDTSFVKRHLRSMLASDPATTNIEERVAVPKFLDLPSNVLSKGLTSVEHALAKFQRWLVKILKRVSLKRQVSLKEKIFGKQDLNKLSDKDVFEEVITKLNKFGFKPKAYKRMAKDKDFEHNEAFLNVHALVEAVGYERAVKVIKTMANDSKHGAMATRMKYFTDFSETYFPQEFKNVAQIPKST